MDPISQFAHVDAARTAVIIDRQEISYGRFAVDVEGLVTWLTHQGLSAGQRVGIFLRNSYWGWVCHLAALRMGLTQATLTQEFREQAAATGLFDVALCESEGVLGSDVARRMLVFSPQNMAPFAEQVAVSSPERCYADPQAEASARRLMLTSGTTGKPRVVSLNTEMLRSRVLFLQRCHGLTADTRLFSFMGMDTMPGFSFPLATWHTGGCVLLGLPVPGSVKISHLPHRQSNLLLVAPGRLPNLLSRDPKPWDGRAARKIIVGGGRLPIPVRDEALARACHQISIIYGATETGGIATGDASLLDRHPGAVGFVVDCGSIQIVDQEGRPRPPGQEGIVRTRTSHMVLGYGGDLESKSDDVFRDAWFYPGDRGVLFEDGLLVITGRVSETLNIGGLKISLLDFEAELVKLPEIKDACAIVLKLDAGDRLALAVVCDEAVDLQALSQQITPRLPVHVQYNLFRVPYIPRNAMGKIPRNALAKKLSEVYQRNIASRNK
jgi:acyl-coenzyme A synthetase/AMP-(fatty) acid ligase